MGFIKGIINTIRVYYLISSKYGHWKSASKLMAINANNKETPWYTYPAIEFLNTINFSDCVVWEYGAGNSTLYWASKSKRVYSVEDNHEWYSRVEAMRIKNAEILYGENKENYVNKISCNDSYDVIVIDGKYRAECTRIAIEKISSHGIIIIDNSDRPEEIACSEFLKENNFIEIGFNGLGPVNGYSWKTSIFFKECERTILRNSNFKTVIGGVG